MSFFEEPEPTYQQVRLKHEKEGTLYGCWIPSEIKDKYILLKRFGDPDYQRFEVLERVGEPREAPLFGDIRAAGQGKLQMFRLPRDWTRYE